MGKTIRRLFSKSKRRNLVYVMLAVWIMFGLIGFSFDVNFAQLATYYGTFAGPAMMYIWGETQRPHNNSDTYLDKMELDRA